MTDGNALTVDERILSLLNHLGIERAHFAGTIGAVRFRELAAYPPTWCHASGVTCPVH